MKYLCTVHGAGVAEGVVIPGPPAGPEEVAKVRVRNGRVSVSQPSGPPGDDEPLRFLLEAWDLNDAIRIASHHPSAGWATLEVRPILVFEPP